MQKKLLTISILVSGRKDTTTKCLDSLKSLRTWVDSELILVDTGCDQELREILTRYTDQIIDFKWCDDFAKARNAGLEKANGEWFLYLDDDEWFEDTAPIARFLESEEAKGYDQAVYKARNYSNTQGTEYTDDWVSRITRIWPDTHFVGKVHEYMSPARGRCKRIDAYVHHYGYAYADAQSKEKHFNRNEPLLKEMILEEPGNMQWRIQLAQEYLSMKKAGELRETGEDALRYISNENQFYINQCRGTFYTAVVISDFLEEKYKDALERIEEYLSDGRNHKMCQCSLYNYGVACALKIKDYKTAEQYSARYMELYLDLEEHPIEDEQERIIAENILFVKDTISQDVYKKNLLDWTISLIRQDRKDDINRERKEQLVKDIRALLHENGDFLRMPQQVWEIGDAHVIDLEEMLLGLDFSQWMAAVTCVVSCTTQAELEQIQKQLKKIQTRDDIRYDYYGMHFADMKVLLEDKDCGYIEMLSHFRAFSEGMLKFYRQIYKPAAFEEEMEMLPDHCRAAVWIERMFACGDNNWQEMLHCIRECAKAYPELGDHVKRLAELIGKEQEQILKDAEEASKELRAMVLQVKPKVIAMLDSGMTAEAYQVVQQLRQMLPDDMEVQKLEVLVESKLM